MRLIRRGDGQLAPEVLRYSFPKPDRSLVIELAILLDDAKDLFQLLLRQFLHADQQPAARSLTTSLERRQQFLLVVVENPWHSDGFAKKKNLDERERSYLKKHCEGPL